MDDVYEEILRRCQFDNSKEYSTEEMKRFNERIVLIDSFDSPILNKLDDLNLHIIKEGLYDFCRRLEEVKGGFKKVIIFGNIEFISKKFLSPFNENLSFEGPRYLFLTGYAECQMILYDYRDEIVENFTDRGIDMDIGT